jgi:flagellar biosynthesis GTPase FlhF
MINADFLLTSDRENIHIDFTWNKWMRSQISDCYVHCLKSLLSNPDLSIEQKLKSYYSIPEFVINIFLDDVLESIHGMLPQERIILSYHTENLFRPSEISIPTKELIDLFEEAKMPEIIEKDIKPLVHVQLFQNKALRERIKIITVKSLDAHDEVHCYFRATKWLDSRNKQLMFKLLHYLTRVRFNNVDLALYPIIPVENENDLVCSNDTEIYFNLNEMGHSEYPEWLDRYLHVREFCQETLKLANEDNKNKEFLENIEKRLKIKKFGMETFSRHVLKLMNNYCNRLEPNQIIEGVHYVFKLKREVLIESKFPILLHDQSITKRDPEKESVFKIVVPQTYDDKYGWHKLWPLFPNIHFKVMHDSYDRSFIDYLVKNKMIYLYPDLQKWRFGANNEARTDAGRTLKNQIRNRSAAAYVNEIKVEEYLMPLNLLSNLNEETALTLLKYLDIYFPEKPRWSPRLSDEDLYKIGLKIKGKYQYRGDNIDYMSSELENFINTKPWLPSTQGLMYKAVVFANRPSINSLLGEGLPYLKMNISDHLANYLEIITEIDRPSLIRFLKNAYKLNNIEEETVQKIYSQLEIFQNKQSQELHLSFYDNDPIIFLPKENKWVKPSECIWSEVEGLEGATTVYSLSTYYPSTFENFFTNHLKISKTYSKEYFLSLWQNMMTNKIKNENLLSNIYKELKILIEKKKDKQIIKFLDEVETVYCSNGDYEDIGLSYFCDRQDLLSIFKDKVQLVFIPKGEGHAAWTEFFQSLRVQRLSDQVRYEVISSINVNTSALNKYITRHFIILLASYLKTKQAQNFDKLKDLRFFEKLLGIREVQIKDSIQIRYKLDYLAQTVKNCPCFLDDGNNLFYISYDSDKLKISEEIFRFLRTSGLDFSDELMEVMEPMIGENSLERIKKKAWTEAKEITDLMDVNDDNLQPSVITEIFDKVKAKNNPLLEKPDSIKEDPTETPIDYSGLNATEPVQKPEISGGKTNSPESGNSSPQRNVSHLNKVIPPDYVKPKVKRNNESTKRDFTKQEKTLENIVDGLRNNENILERKKYILENLNQIKNDIKSQNPNTFGWLLSLTLAEYYYDQEKSNSNGFTIKFDKVSRHIDRKDILLLRFPNRYVSNKLESYENIKLEIKDASQTWTIIVQSISVSNYEVRARLWKSSDIDGINFNSIEKAIIKVENVDFLWSSLYQHLNDLEFSPKESLTQRLPAKHKIKFIFGPPGTGKTTTIVDKHLIPLIKMNKKKVLVLTPTNKAADVICEKLINGQVNNGYFRFGNTGSSLVESHDCFISKNLSMEYESFALITTIARYPYDNLNFENGKSVKISSIKWDKIIIDEASMISLAQTLNVLYHHRNTEIIIAGDPFQIQPILSIADWKDQNIYSLLGLNNFDMEVTPKCKIPVEKLMKQFRSVPSIGKLYGAYSYNDKIITHRSEKQNSIYFLYANQPLKALNVIKYPVRDTESLYESKYLEKSSYHIYLSVFFIEYLIKFCEQFEKSDRRISIGIISPYRAQSDILFKLINANHKSLIYCDIQISTIHGFQGDECDMVFCIFNTPVSTSSDTIINNKNVINVAISRAKDNLIVLMPENFQRYKELNNIHELIDSQKNKYITTASQIEEYLFNSNNYIEKNCFLTSHHSVNVFGQSSYKYEIKADEEAIDIQVN